MHLRIGTAVQAISKTIATSADLASGRGEEAPSDVETAIDQVQNQNQELISKAQEEAREVEHFHLRY